MTSNRRRAWVLALFLIGCGDDGEGGGTTVAGSTGSTGDASTGPATSSSTSGGTTSSSTTAMPGGSTTDASADETGTPLSCGDTICAPGLICVRQVTETSTTTGGSGTAGAGGTTETDWLCRSRPEECTPGSPADCACAAVVCGTESCLCEDEGVNQIACVPDPSCG